MDKWLYRACYNLQIQSLTYFRRDFIANDGIHYCRFIVTLELNIFGPHIIAIGRYAHDQCDAHEDTACRMSIGGSH